MGGSNFEREVWNKINFEVRNSNSTSSRNYFSVVRTSIPKAKPRGDFFFKAGPALGRGAGKLTMRPTAEVKGEGTGGRVRGRRAGV